jgi:DNA-directed RNA polymerase specialized sigma24 family protein
MKESLSETDAQVVAAWLREARDGSTDALAEAFNYCQRYLSRRIRREIPRELQSKFGESDLLQAAYVVVQEAFADFQGATPREFLSWLFQITLHQASNFRRYYRDTKKRAVGRGVPRGEQKK